jgi:hypothetical protein
LPQGTAGFATARFDGGDVGGGDSETLGDLGLGQPEHLAGVFELAADDLRVDREIQRLYAETDAQLSA